LNLSVKTQDADVFRLLSRLQPQNCGIDLIRLGAKNDGGYLIPNDLDGIGFCFSPGVSTMSEFENQLADLGIKSYLADYSVDCPPILRPEFTFDKKFLGASDRDEYMTLKSWKDRYLEKYSGDLLLQMDIEGAEYEVILNTPDLLLDQFRIIVIEFHRLHWILDCFAFQIFVSCFEKLLKSFYVVHIHPNNYGKVVRLGDIEIPSVMEFTFLNKRRVNHVSPERTFPHEFDSDNAPRDHIVLPRCWYSAGC
jgi:hypothetical protein